MWLMRHQAKGKTSKFLYLMGKAGEGQDISWKKQRHPLGLSKLISPPDPLPFVLLRHAKGDGGRSRSGGSRHGLQTGSAPGPLS